MKFIPISLLAWLAVAANLHVFAHWGNPASVFGLLLLPAVALGCTLWAARHLPEGKRGLAARLGWWAVALPLWGLAILMGWARWEAARPWTEDRQQFLIAGILMLLVGVFALRKRTSLRWQTFAEAAGAGTLILTALAAYGSYYEACTRAIAVAADARWTQIGRPMAEFEKTLRADTENAALATLKEILRQQVDGSLYKPAQDEVLPTPDQARLSVLSRVAEEVSRVRPAGDVLPLTEESATDARRAALDEAYTKILAQEAPVWAWNPQDGFRAQAPNFLGLRQMSQLIAADAMRRLEQGDVAGAVQGTWAMHRVLEKLDQHPMIVNLMIKVAIDALLAPREARLPAEAGALDKLALEAVRQRETLARSLQMDAWCFTRHLAERTDLDTYGFGVQFWGITPELPKWAQRIVGGAQIRRECALSSATNAELVQCLAQKETLALPDLGTDEMDAIVVRSQSRFAPNILRAYMRLNGALLLREQTELIRLAREKMAAGLPLEPRASVVLPHLRWVFTADLAARTVSLKIEQLPKWLMEGSVTPPDFWLLPLDGSKTWQFGEFRRTAAQ